MSDLSISRSVYDSVVSPLRAELDTKLEADVQAACDENPRISGSTLVRMFGSRGLTLHRARTLLCRIRASSSNLVEFECCVSGEDDDDSGDSSENSDDRGFVTDGDCDDDDPDFCHTTFDNCRGPASPRARQRKSRAGKKEMTNQTGPSPKIQRHFGCDGCLVEPVTCDDGVPCGRPVHDHFSFLGFLDKLWRGRRRFENVLRLMTDIPTDVLGLCFDAILSLDV